MITNEKNKINNTALLNKVESEYLKEDVPNVRVGDTVRLGVKFERVKKLVFKPMRVLLFLKKIRGLIKQLLYVELCKVLELNVVFYYIHQKFKQLKLKDHLKLDVQSFTTYVSYQVRQHD